MKASSIGLKVIGYFFRNPEEELSTADIRAKWDAPCETTHLSAALKAGMLQVRLEDNEDGDTERIYAAGPALLAALEA